MIIGLSGLKSSGKDTVASIFREYGYITLSMADPLKDMISSLFSWDREMIEGATIESRQWREQPNKEWQCLAGHGIFENDKIISPRIVLQKIGTELFRQHIRDDFWILCLKAKIEGLKKEWKAKGIPYKGVVIKDARFLNELNICDITIRIDRFSYTEEELNKMHISETEHLQHDFDYIIENKSTIEYLSCRIRSIVHDMKQ